MTGIYGGDGEQLSLRATFPQLRALELEHGSLLRALPAQSAPAERPPFVSLRDGMDVLARTLVSRLERTSVVRATATTLRRTADGYEVALGDGERLRADGVVLATPAFVTAGLLDKLDPELADAHAAILYASSVVITLGFSTDEVAPLDGYGYVIPRVEGGVHVELAEVGGTRAGGKRPRAGLRRQIRRTQPHRRDRRRACRARAQRARAARRQG
jgi:oxygen-dependent protoporphyrinogen oxidase